MRRLIVKLHLMIAAFFAPILLMVALSGGLYLLGQKGQTLKTPIALSDDLAVAIAANPTEAGGLKHFLLTSILSTISNISKSAAAP